MSKRKPAAKSAPSSDTPVKESVSLGSLNDPDTFQGFTTHDLISGLHGVCMVLDSEIVGTELEDRAGTMNGLAMAAKVLSSILHNEVHS